VGGDKRKKIRPKNSTIEPLYTLSVPCLKIQGGGAGAKAPSADAHV